ncbi:hypothetical protein DH2020_009537 [Rehmannia glutinosa]|uniref:Protein kinase domain-containing protein n=1 Tax=Rehmannia glutinosa TaxID=99300 RepID=A0ABR0X780_REHGL
MLAAAMLKSKTIVGRPVECFGPGPKTMTTYSGRILVTPLMLSIFRSITPAETPPYSAPEIVYTTSEQWRILAEVWSGDFQSIRVLLFTQIPFFCEIQLEVTKQNERVFTISINNQTLEIQADVIFWTGGTEIPTFRDYIVWASDDGRRGKKDLRLSLFPNMEGRPKYSNALLNGLEIFKLSDSNRSLAAANPEPGSITSPPAVAVIPRGKKKTGASSVIYAVIGSVIGVLAVGAAVSFLILRRRRNVKDSVSTSGVAKSSWVPLFDHFKVYGEDEWIKCITAVRFMQIFLLDEIKTATKLRRQFRHRKRRIRNVYKGFIDVGGGAITTVAIKRLNPSSNQGAREFLTEILRHLHLVSLIGYSDENGEMILVYDYMSHGTLRDHLYNSDNSPLNWKQRLQICIGAARGLHYLHTGAKHSIIHRDVKSTNILLDEKFVAKMSDFGLSKVGPTGVGNTHVSTVVKGSFGYVDPEYYRRQQLTDKSDVYSFGVVLFEVLCARPAIIPSLPREQEPNTTTDEEMFSGSSEAFSGSKSSGLSTVSSEKLKSEEVFSEIMNPSAR